MSSLHYMLLLLTLLLWPSRTAQAAQPELPQHVVMISIDGLKPEYYLEADKRGLKIPSLRRLMSMGSYAQGVEGVWPTVTYPSHTTLVTGVHPIKHGILNNHPFDPLMTNLDGWYWYAEDIKVKTLWDAAKEKGLTTGNSFWPVTVGARIDYNFPQYWRARNLEDDKLIRVLVTPGLAKEVEQKYGTLPTESRSDKERADAAEYIIQFKRPNLMLVYLTDLDSTQHSYGPFSKEALAKLEVIDEQVGRVIKATEAAGIFSKTAFVVVSDHGFLPIHSLIRPGVLLKDFGLIEADERGRVRNWRAAAWSSGGLCAIMLKDLSDAAARKMVEEIFRLAARDPANGILRIHSPEAVARSGGFPQAALVLEAAEGFSFSSSLEGPLVVPTTNRGSHGYAPNRPEMRAAFIIAGPGVKRGQQLGVVRMIDIAPTIARLLDLKLPDAEGQAIESLFVKQ